jgi:hypothetical protein
MVIMVCCVSVNVWFLWGKKNGNTLKINYKYDKYDFRTADLMTELVVELFTCMYLVNL